MATLIAFSGRDGDHLLVEGTVEEVQQELAPNARNANGLAQLTMIPKKLEPNFGSAPVWINPERVAYLHTTPLGRS